MQKPRKIERCKEEDLCEELQHEVGYFACAGGSGRGEVGSSHKICTGGERKAENGMRLLCTGALMELRQVALGSSTQSFWLRRIKVKHVVVGINRC